MMNVSCEDWVHCSAFIIPHSSFASRGQLEHHATMDVEAGVGLDAATRGGAIEVACRVLDQTCGGQPSVRSPSEGVEHLKPGPARAQLEHHSTSYSAAETARGAAVLCGAVQVAQS